MNSQRRRQNAQSIYKATPHTYTKAQGEWRSVLEMLSTGQGVVFTRVFSSLHLQLLAEQLMPRQVEKPNMIGQGSIKAPLLAE